MAEVTERIHICTAVAAKQPERQQLSEDVDEYLRQGGEIEQLPNGIPCQPWQSKIAMELAKRAKRKRHAST